MLVNITNDTGIENTVSVLRMSVELFLSDSHRLCMSWECWVQAIQARAQVIHWLNYLHPNFGSSLYMSLTLFFSFHYSKPPRLNFSTTEALFPFPSENPSERSRWTFRCESQFPLNTHEMRHRWTSLYTDVSTKFLRRRFIDSIYRLFNFHDEDEKHMILYIPRQFL